MAIKPQCVAALNQAAGRILTAGELKGIEDRLSDSMRSLARQDPEAWIAKSMDQRFSEAAQIAMQDLLNESRRKLVNAQLQVIATAATEQRISGLQSNMKVGRSKALSSDIINTSIYADAVKREAVSGLLDTINAAKSREGASIGRKITMFLFDAENPLMTKDLVMEIFSRGKGDTGNPIAKKGAEAWISATDGLRKRFNSAGGDIGKLEYGYLPQAHDAGKVRDMGKDSWAAKTLPLLDRSRYLREDGSRMSDGEVLNFLRSAWDTISTDGLNKLEPGQFRGTGARANKGREARQIHFQDGEAYLQYNAEFGTGSMYDAMVGHIGAVSRDIALVERYGPNANAQFRLQSDIAEKADGGLKRAFGFKPDVYWNLASGFTSSPQSATIATVGQTARNLQVAWKLGGAVITSMTDLPTAFITAGYNKLPYMELLNNLARSGSREAKDFANAHGLIADSIISDLNRFSGDFIANNVSGRLANSTMKLTLMNWWTDTLRRGFSMTMMQGLGRLSETRWSDLTEWDRSHLGRKGITEADWDVVNQAQLTDYRGAKMLTPEAIAASGSPRANEVTGKILGFITDESEYAVINPDLAARAMTSAGLQAGTWPGEIARSVMQFKSFPIAMISRHWRRMMEGHSNRQLEGAPTLANAAHYGAALGLSLTALGAIVFQTKQITSGKDPVDMSTPKFWARAVAQGGGLGFLGDILLRDSTDDRAPQQGLFELAGPTAGSFAQLWNLTKGNIDESIADKDTHAAAEAIRFAKSHLPYVNLWYTRTAFEHLFLQSIQENLSPGYLSRMRQRAHNDWNQGFWWEPGETAPSRAPNFEAIGGR